MDKSREHLYYIDILRIISVLAVLFAHVNLDYVYWCYWSVVLFTVISGGLMLTHDRIDIKRLYTVNIFRVVTAFFFWSCVYSLSEHVLLPHRDGKYVNFKLMITSIFEGHFHLWYCYMIIGLFILAPFIKAAIEYDEKIGLYFLVIAFFFSILVPALQELRPFAWTTGITENIGLGGFRFAAYFVLGYYLMKYKPDKYLRRILLVAGVPALILFVLFARSSLRTVLETCIAAWLFLLAESFFTIKNKWVASFIAMLGDAGFGVYLIHELFNMIYDRMFGLTYTGLYDFGKYLFTVLLSFICIILIRKKHRIAGFIS